MDRAVIVLCFFLFLKEFRPSEPFLSPFLHGPKNFTEQQIREEIFPIGTYSNMALLIVIFLLTDWVRYKPFIVLQSISGIITWSLLLWTDNLIFIQLAEVAYGLFSACDVASSAYLYAKIDKKAYQRATGQTKATLLASKSLSGLLGQLLVLYSILDFAQLNYLTLIALSLAAIWSICVPRVDRSVYSCDQENPQRNIEIEDFIKSPSDNNAPSSAFYFSTLYGIWRKAMSSKTTLKWSIWWAMSLCGYLQVTYYIQLLWQAVIIKNSINETKIYHGFSNTANSLIGALCTYAVGYLKIDWSKYGELTMGIAATLQGILLFYISYFVQDLIIHYLIYALFKILFQTSNIIASSEIAKTLMADSYGLVFGINQFFALIEQSVLTLVVTNVFHLDIKIQFVVYGVYFATIGIGFFISAAKTILYTRKAN